MLLKNSLKLVHTSDTHLGDPYGHPDSHNSFTNVINSLDHIKPDFLLIAGDIFDNEQVNNSVIDFFLKEIKRAEVPVIILPGNHDLMHETSVYKRTAFECQPSNLFIFKDPLGSLIDFNEYGISFWGKAMYEHSPKFKPLSNIYLNNRNHWLIGLAHGHFESFDYKSGRSSLIFPDDIANSKCDYIALGHWDIHTDVSQNGIPAFYSGCPSKMSGQKTGMINLVILDRKQGVSITQYPLAN